MPEIAGPRWQDDYADRGVDCEFAIEPAFEGLVRAAEGQGWTEHDVAYALLSLARAHMKGLMTDMETASTYNALRDEASII